jgi:hypothetical protein
MRAREGFTGDEFEKDILQVEAILKDQFVFDIQENAASWSGKYTLDLFEEEIKTVAIVRIIKS